MTALKHKRIVMLSRLLLPVALAALLPLGAAAQEMPSYWYSREGEPVKVPNAYVAADILSLRNEDGSDMTGCTDMFIRDNGEIFILNGDRGEIAVYDAALVRQRTIQTLTGDSGQSFTLNKPEGIFVSADGLLYVADTENHRILRSDTNGLHAVAFGRPAGVDELEKDEDYLPRKIVADSSGRMFVAAKSVVNGLLSLTREGKFITYLGAPPVSVNPLVAFYRRFLTEEQRNRIVSYIPTEYSNIAIDGDGFLFGSISAISEEDFEKTLQSMDTSGTVTAVRKINSVGQDILRRQGQIPLIGDLREDAQSSIVDVALCRYGVYCLLDAANGRIFAYDANGNMLFAFGEISDRKGCFLQPVAIGVYNDELFVLDAKLAQVVRFRQTEYGEMLFGAIAQDDAGNFDASFEEWQKVFDQNPSFDLAYVGVGNLYLKQNEYKQAMDLFKMAGDMENYSKAYELYRQEAMKAIAPFLFGAVVLLLAILLLIKPVKRIVQYCRE